MTASDPVFKPVTLPDFQNGNDSHPKPSHIPSLHRFLGVVLPIKLAFSTEHPMKAPRLKLSLILGSQI